MLIPLGPSIRVLTHSCVFSLVTASCSHTQCAQTHTQSPRRAPCVCLTETCGGTHLPSSPHTCESSSSCILRLSELHCSLIHPLPLNMLLEVDRLACNLILCRSLSHNHTPSHAHIQTGRHTPSLRSLPCSQALSYAWFPVLWQAPGHE